eukprot:m.18568 g.18568  ORF g.18568 m.18568 type:complete len:536 (+) comp27680_c0_seq1:165-1772(+)
MERLVRTELERCAKQFRAQARIGKDWPPSTALNFLPGRIQTSSNPGLLYMTAASLYVDCSSSDSGVFSSRPDSQLEDGSSRNVTRCDLRRRCPAYWRRSVCTSGGLADQLDHLRRVYSRGDEKTVGSKEKKGRLLKRRGETLQEVAPEDQHSGNEKSIRGRVDSDVPESVNTENEKVEAVDEFKMEDSLSNGDGDAVPAVSETAADAKGEVFYRLSRPKHSPAKFKSRRVSKESRSSQNQSVLPLKNPELFDRLAAPRSAGPLTYRFVYPVEKSPEKKQHKSVSYELFERLAKPKVRLQPLKESVTDAKGSVDEQLFERLSQPNRSRRRVSHDGRSRPRASSSIIERPLLSVEKPRDRLKAQSLSPVPHHSRDGDGDDSFRLAVDSIFARHSRLYSSGALDALEVTREASCLLDEESEEESDFSDNDNELFLSTDEDILNDDNAFCEDDSSPWPAEKDITSLSDDSHAVGSERKPLSATARSKQAPLTVEGVLKFADLLLEDNADSAKREGCSNRPANAGSDTASDTSTSDLDEY